MTEDYPIIILGLKIEEKMDEDIPPFYLSLNVCDMILHNALLDSGASHNLMPKVVVDNFRLEITRPFILLISEK